MSGMPVDDAHTPIATPPPQPRMQWDAWGTAEQAAPLPPAARALLATILRGKPHPIRRVDASAVKLSASRATPDDLDALARIVGADAVTTADARRLAHLGGKSTPDLIARRSSDPQTAPDLVAAPASHADTLAVLRACAALDLAVVVFGGGTSVVGGVDPVPGRHRAVVALDVSHIDGLFDLDETSLVATLGAGTTGPQAERLLNARGFTLGHFPQSFEYASIGGFAATRSSGQASSGYGRFDDLVHAMRVATPAGELDLGRAPRSAAGPDLRQLFLGSEGAFGVLTEITVRIRPLAAATAYGAWTFADFATGADALRDLTQRSIHPSVIRLSDAAESRVNAAPGGHVTRMRGCLAVATFEADDAAAADALRDATGAVLAAHGARDRGEAAARSWERGRFHAPMLRDALLDAGVLAETLETASTWTLLPAVKAAVTDALVTALTAEGTKPMVLCHISHVYPAGASLYFTVVAALTADPSGQWQRAKDAASRAIMAGGATITHHHGVGRDHREYLAEEIGALGVDVLRAVKRTVDPTGIMNPGVLVEH